MSTERRLNLDLSSVDPSTAALRLRQILRGNRVMRVLILSSDTGGGHRASAAALAAALLHMYPGRVRVHTADFWVDFAQGRFAAFPSQYAFLAKHPALWKLTYEVMRFPPVRAVVEGSWNVAAHGNVRREFQRFAPDLVVSVHPLVNTLAMRVLDGIAQEARVPRCAYFTVVTDLGGCHPTWMHKGGDMTYVPTAAVGEVAARCGLRDDRVRTFGLPVRQAFWDNVTAATAGAGGSGLPGREVEVEDGEMLVAPPPVKGELREKLGMRADLVALLLIGGGDGVGNLGKVAKAVAAKVRRDHGCDGAQMVVVCGKNEKLYDSLVSHDWGISVIVKGYVGNMDEWMNACDVLCTKAGPGTIAEGLICGMPILVTAYLPGQEEANVRYIVEKKVGEFGSRPTKIAAIASRWIADKDALAAMSEAAFAEARPNATLEIAADIWDVAVGHMADSAARLERAHKVRAAQSALIRRRLMGSGGISASGSSSSIVSNSQLVTRVQVLLRLTFGSAMAAEAAGLQMSASRLRVRQ